MKTILASLSAVALSLSFSACHTAPKHGGTCPITGASAPAKTSCCAKAKAGATKSCCATTAKTAKSKKSGAACCG